jgi:hypothetical protein
MSFQEDKKELVEMLEAIEERIEISEDGLKNHSEGVPQFLVDMLKQQVKELKAQLSVGQLVLQLMEAEEKGLSEPPKLEVDKRFS